MKKAKIFLTTLTVLAVVGGALAFKAKTQFPYYTCDTSAKKCIIFSTSVFETTTLSGSSRNFNTFNAPCDASHPCTTLVKATI